MNIEFRQIICASFVLSILTSITPAYAVNYCERDVSKCASNTDASLLVYVGSTDNNQRTSDENQSIALGRNLKGAVLAFDRNTCPNGWDEYELAYGRFIRGVDKSGRKIDPEGQRALGEKQGDMIREHHHSTTVMVHNNGVDGVDSALPNSYEHHNEPKNTGDYGGKETRPKNVALLYCIKR